MNERPLLLARPLIEFVHALAMRHLMLKSVKELAQATLSRWDTQRR
jgi:hypothetical protein